MLWRRILGWKMLIASVEPTFNKERRRDLLVAD